MVFPATRPRRLRSREAIRRMVRETRLTPDQLVWPLFVTEGRESAIASMPGVRRLSVRNAVRAAQEARRLGISGILLFGIPASKDEKASGAYAADGIVQTAVRAIKDKVPELVVVTDVCLCEYMSHGHCGVVAAADKAPSAALHSSEDPRRTPKVRLRSSSSRVLHLELSRQPLIDNDLSVELLARVAVSHAEAGADIVAPSDMMDGRVRAIRKTLDKSGYTDTAILSYAVKYASAYYGPFREAAGSAPQFGDRKSYQMDPANLREALREAQLDEKEGADILMVKPALPSLDVIAAVRAATRLPVAAYQVSGEYAMIKAAVRAGWLDEKAVVMESLLAIRRAGADLIVTYFAKDAAKALA